MQKDVSISWSNFKNGAIKNLGGNPVVLSEEDITCERGVLVKALNSNTGDVYVGYSAGKSNSTHGYELGSGESVFIEINKVGKIYVSASATAQGVCWISV